MLLPLQVSEPKPPVDDRRVTYILDRDLVRFGKFAGAVLAVFITVGATLYGFKLQEGLEKAKTLQAEAKELRDKARDDLQATESRIKTLNDEVDKAITVEQDRLVKTELLLSQIQGTNDRATEMFKSMTLRLTQRQSASLPVLKAAQPDKARQGLQNKYWTNGATLRILFLDGDDRSRQAVKDAFAEWGKYANLHFEFIGSGRSDIRVSFKDDGYYSYLGTDALAVPATQATLNLGPPSIPVPRKFILRETGHALGLINELQNPQARIPWDKTQTYEYFLRPPYLWSKATIDFNLFAQVSQENLGPYRPFDPDSVMTLDIPAELVGGMRLGGGKELSPSDKALIARIYPKS